MNRLYINKDWSTLKKLMILNAAQGGGSSQKSVTGNPVTFKTTKAEPLISCKVSMNPVQDLHGYDSPWPAGGGKNLLNATEEGVLRDVRISEIRSEGAVDL